MVHKFKKMIVTSYHITKDFGTSLEIQCLRFCISKAGGARLILGSGNKIPHATQPKNKIKKKKVKDFRVKKKKSNMMLI